MAFKTILADTNILIDAALHRKPFINDTLKIIDVIQSGRVAGVVSGHSFDTIFYILRSNYDREDIYEILREIRKTFDVAAINEKVIDKAIQLKWPDFEDAIHYEAALTARCDAIVTRNEKDFKNAELPVFSPAGFLEELES
jgi:predicted nucleic acid-binding protein